MDQHSGRKGGEASTSGGAASEDATNVRGATDAGGADAKGNITTGLDELD